MVLFKYSLNPFEIRAGLGPGQDKRIANLARLNPFEIRAGLGHELEENVQQPEES